MKALIWDLDDTLYDLMIPFRDACEGVMGIRLEDPEAAYKQFRFRGDEVFEASQRGEMSLYDSRILRFTRAMADCGIEAGEEQADRFQKAYEAAQGQIRLSERMKGLLAHCKAAGVPMGVITNGPESHQKMKIHALGLESWIPKEKVVISGAVGVMKPETGIFRIAETVMGLGPEDCIMVGDNYKSDICGAMEAGWQGIWFNRRKKPMPDGGSNALVIVETEEALEEAIRKLIAF